MATVTHSRRVTRRYPISKSQDARIEFEWPGPGGQRLSLPLVDLSVSGLSFRFEDEPLAIESGSTLSEVVIRLGKCAIRGDLLVMHVTARPAGGTYCGALFYPAKDADLLQLKSVIAGIEAVMGD